MPTGYTAGIVDGKVNDFPQFAMTCMRAFGCAVHMREESLDKPYEPREPDGYYLENLEEAKKKLKTVKELSDQQIVDSVGAELLEREKSLVAYIKKTKEIKDRLESMLAQVYEWNAPTEEHNGFKKFMIEQLQITIDQDGSCAYSLEELGKVRENMKGVDATIERKKMIDSANRDIKYYQEHRDKEVENCKKSNEWASQLIESLHSNIKK